MKINPTSLAVRPLLSATNEQFVIPPYQRRYSWRERQVNELIDDIRLLDQSDTHLMGSIVCLTSSHTAGINKLELVDGQQRLTTLIIMLHCIRERFLKEYGESSVSELDHLLHSKPLGGPVVRKLLLDSRDATDFDRLLGADMHLSEGWQNQRLADAFKIVRGWIRDEAADEVQSFAYKLQNNATMIRLDVSDAKDAFKLFETINDRGLRLSSTDIIKNFVLGNAARFGATDLAQARSKWAELIGALDGVDSDAFFRHFLTVRLSERVSRSKVVGEFKRLFMSEVKEAAKLPERHLYADDEEDEDQEELEATEGDDPKQNGKRDEVARITFKEFVSKLTRYANTFGQLVTCNTDNSKLNERLRNLKLIKSAPAYGFLMHLRVGGIDDKQLSVILDLTESLMLRRHICRKRTGETDALFAKICSCDPKSSLSITRESYREVTPSDEEFEADFARTDFSISADRARYCLEKIEMHESAHGKYKEFTIAGGDNVQIEHIIPKKITTKKSKEEFGDWVAYLGEGALSKHKINLWKIGNLTLIAGKLNLGASNNPFYKKRAAYKESKIKMTYELSERTSFRFKELDARSKELAKSAVAIWPKP